MSTPARDGDQHDRPEDAMAADREEEIEENEPRSGVPGKDEQTDD
ncbi:hypothetical protein GCM10027047_23100 [Rhodococcus aerolatus]